ncbi:MAG: EpsI family protein [Nitrospiraceae bacterium]|nr:MAG: EpsI family protein [Nitrospiraceae bacterium]
MKGPTVQTRPLSKKIWIQAALLAAGFIYAYASVFVGLADEWWNNKDSSHGFLVPLISFYIIWTKKDRLRNLPLRPDSLRGIPLVLFAGSFFVLGDLAGLNLLQELSSVVIIAGMVLMLMGTTYFRELIFPVAYLLFMVPFLGAFSDKIHWPFQLFSAKLGTGLMELAGIPAFLETQYIVLPGTTLEVAAECSGLRYLISIIAVGIPLAYFTQKTWPRKIILVVMAVFIAVLANSVRVAFVGAWSYYFNAEIVHGPFHIFQGFFVSVIGFISLFAGAFVFSRIPVARPLRANPAEDCGKEGLAGMSGNSGFDISWACAMVLLLFLGASSFVFKSGPVPPGKLFSALPFDMGGWRWDGSGAHQPLPFRMENADEELTRTYQNTSAEEIVLYVGYLESQSQGKELVDYLSKKLHRGAVEIRISAGDKMVTVNKTIMNEDHKSYMVSFWYDLNGRKFTDMYKAKIATILDAVTRRSSNGALIMVVSDIKQSDNPDSIAGRQQDFIKGLVPVLDKYLNN